MIVDTLHVITEVRDTVIFSHCIRTIVPIMYAGVIRYSPINCYTQMLVNLSGSRDLHWLIGMLACQCTHKQALNVASDRDET